MIRRVAFAFLLTIEVVFALHPWFERLIQPLGPDVRQCYDKCQHTLQDENLICVQFDDVSQHTMGKLTYNCIQTRCQRMLGGSSLKQLHETPCSNFLKPQQHMDLIYNHYHNTPSFSRPAHPLLYTPEEHLDILHSYYQNGPRNTHHYPGPYDDPQRGHFYGLNSPNFFDTEHDQPPPHYQHPPYYQHPPHYQPPYYQHPPHYQPPPYHQPPPRYQPPGYHEPPHYQPPGYHEPPSGYHEPPPHYQTPGFRQPAPYSPPYSPLHY